MRGHRETHREEGHVKMDAETGVRPGATRYELKEVKKDPLLKSSGKIVLYPVF